ncbi:WD40 repeat-like protein [Xylaria acuta]|nr:WD40 repeat-like protein [Xylaria acuta]
MSAPMSQLPYSSTGYKLYVDLLSNAPEEKRHLILDAILAQCYFSQLSYLATSVKALTRIDFLAVLPSEISIRILQYLDATTLSKAAQVSQLWKGLADDDIIWYRMCQQHINKKCSRCGRSLPLLQVPQQRQQPENPDSDSFCPRDWSPSLKRPGDSKPESDVPHSHGSCLSPPTKRQRMLHHHAIELNTTYTRPWKEATVLEGHTDSVMCLQIHSKFLVTGSYDASIRLWNLGSGSLVQTILGHTAGIHALQFDGSKIVSGSLDEIIKIRNWQTGQCLLSISNHNNAIVGLDLAGKILASSSMDKTVKIWNFEGKEAFTLRGHKDGVNSVSMDTTSRTLISALDDFTLRLWGLDTRQCIRVFEGHCGQSDQVTVMAFSACPERSLPPPYIISGSIDKPIRLWNTASSACVRVDFGHTERVWTVATDSLRVVSGAGDSLAKVWDAVTGNCLRTIAGHTGPITCIGPTDSILATGSDDCRVIVYNFKPDGVKWRDKGLTVLFR